MTGEKYSSIPVTDRKKGVCFMGTCKAGNFQTVTAPKNLSKNKDQAGSWGTYFKVALAWQAQFLLRLISDALSVLLKDLERYKTPQRSPFNATLTGEGSEYEECICSTFHPLSHQEITYPCTHLLRALKDICNMNK